MPSFSRDERLKSRTLIGRLFKGGTAFLAYPLRVVWLPVDGPAAEGAPAAPVQVAIAVPKRSFKTAVARNRLKRRIREAYRLHKDALYEKLAARQSAPVALMLIYIAREAVPYSEIEAGIKKMVRKF
jgi:ribonuclease P protein component